mgnify:FL=1
MNAVAVRITHNQKGHIYSSSWSVIVQQFDYTPNDFNAYAERVVKTVMQFADAYQTVQATDSSMAIEWKTEGDEHVFWFDIDEDHPITRSNRELLGKPWESKGMDDIVIKILCGSIDN